MGIVLLANANSGASVVQHRCGPLSRVQPAFALLSLFYRINGRKTLIGNKIKTDKEIATHCALGK